MKWEARFNIGNKKSKRKGEKEGESERREERKKMRKRKENLECVRGVGSQLVTRTWRG